MYDLIIIGMGISGISASIYAKRAGLNVLLIDKSDPGGTLNIIPEINNYPGFSSISGPDLALSLFKEVENLNIPYVLENVTDIILEDIKTIKTDSNVYQSKNILIATGRKPRRLGLPHESDFIGRGISTCALCDGNFYKNKEVAVVGGGSSALSEAIYLSRIASKVYLIHRKNEFRAEESIKQELAKCSNIELLLNEEITSLIIENDIFKGVKLKNKIVEVACLFTYIGFVPNTDFLKNTNIKMQDNYIIVDKNNMTNISGVYASGDVIKKDIYQLINASSEGAIAAINIANNMKN